MLTIITLIVFITNVGGLVSQCAQRYIGHSKEHAEQSSTVAHQAAQDDYHHHQGAQA